MLSLALVIWLGCYLPSGVDVGVGFLKSLEVLLACLAWFDAVLPQNVVSVLAGELLSPFGDRLAMLSPFRLWCPPFLVMR